MTRPSHWILFSVAGFATVVTATGSWNRVLTGPSASHWVAVREQQAQRAVERGRPVELFGALVDRRGEPLVGAEVRVAGEEPAVRTDVDGRFTLMVEGRRARELALQAVGCAPSHAIAVPGEPMFTVLDDATPWGEAERAPSAKSLLFGEGFLKDEAGAVAFGCVTVRETGATVFADESGRFHVPLPLDLTVTLEARDRAGRVAVSKPFRPSRRQGLVPIAEMVLAPGVELAGFVRDEHGLTREGAVVVATCGALRRAAVTGRDGSFALAGLCAHTEYGLEVLPLRGEHGSRETIELAGDAERDLFMRAAADRRLRVVDAQDAPCAQVHVVAHGEVAAAYGKTDDDGFVAFAGLAPSEPRYEVRDAQLVAIEVRSVANGVIHVAR